MPGRTGNAAYIGFGVETTVGTRVAPTHFIPILSETLKEEIDRTEDQAIVPDELLLSPGQRRASNVKVGGGVQTNLYQAGQEVLLEHLFGAVDKDATDPAAVVRTYTMADLVGLGLSWQAARPGVGGSIIPFDYAGMKIGQAEIAWKSGELVTLGLTLVGMAGLTGQTLATPSIIEDADSAFHFVDASITVDGTTTKVRGGKWTFDNKVVADRFNSSANSDEPLTTDRRDFGVTIDKEFVDLTHYAAYKAADVVTISTTFERGDNSLVISMDCQYDENSPGIAGRGILMQSMPFKALGSDAVSAVLTNATA